VKIDEGRLIFHFAEGDATMRETLGGKGAGLAEMTRIGLSVPPGFTITTGACRLFISGGQRFPDGLCALIDAALARLERESGKRFGDPRNPLLVSVRSGAVFSMPGMMDTILNLGLNDATVRGLGEATGNQRFALDCYRRFVQMFGEVVMKVEMGEFEHALENARLRAGVRFDSELPAAALADLVEEYRRIVRGKAGREFPQDPREQLLMAVTAVFASWNNPRAVVYRRMSRIADDLGTAVNVQMMVFGNTGADSGTGVIFTRNPANGRRELYGEYLTNAQGEDVVAGIRTPYPIARMAVDLPAAYAELPRVADLLERHYRDMQDIEFTVEHGKLFILQTRSGKRTAAAAVRIAHDMVVEGVIDRREAVSRIEPEQVVKLLHRGVDPAAKLDVIAQGLPASPGAASGKVVFDANVAEEAGHRGEAVILVRPETTPDDIHGIVAAQGVLTSRGGMTCHAAIVARGMGKPCVVGCEALRIDLAERQATAGAVTLREGDLLSIDGGSGQVIRGPVPLVDPDLGDDFGTVLAWADEIRRLGVRANADTPEDARKAREFGAEGIGLCRTEHMFMAADRLPVMQEMILAAHEEERRSALDRLLPMQQADFEGILEAMAGYPVTIRLLDPPLHEFLPNADGLAVDITRLKTLASVRPLAPEERLTLASREEIFRKVRALAESNPMLGFRGCRLGIVFPEIYEMQCRAIFRAAASLRRRGVDARPEVMIPLVSHALELAPLRELVLSVAAQETSAANVAVEFTVGTMIEVPRAALTAGRIAGLADFFSFGTNDLTQTTFGFSRDDAEGKFLHVYIQKNILAENPFAVLDEEGVGRLVEMATRDGRAARPRLKVGICGEHGGDPRSIAFCHRAGLDYVSCSPFRVPIARLAAAQASLAETGGREQRDR
jgi:pyruvate,orthophosphate dikinase